MIVMDASKDSQDDQAIRSIELTAAVYMFVAANGKRRK